MSLLTSSPSQLAKLCIAMLILASGFGCDHSPRSGIVRGDTELHITSDGTPLDGAMIDLSCPDNGEAYGGKLDANGVVRITDVAVGKYVVTIQPPEGPPPLPGVVQEPRQKLTWKLPVKVRRPETTPFVADVTEGGNQFAFDVMSAESGSGKK